MKLKLLLFSLLLTGGILSARGSVETTQQDTMKGLIFSESFGNSGWSGYWEITNMNSFDVNLGEVEFGVMVPWGSPGNEWNPGDRRMMLPNHILHPGESFVIANCYDFNPEQFAKGLEGYGENLHVIRFGIWQIYRYISKKNLVFRDSIVLLREPIFCLIYGVEVNAFS
jgi:hypothetical protein